MKNIYSRSLFLLFFSVVNLQSAGFFKPQRTPYYDMGKDLVQGGAEGVGELMRNANGEDIGHLVHQGGKAVVANMGNAMKDGGPELGQGIEDLMKNAGGGVGKGLEKAFEKGGQLDVGMDNLASFNKKFFQEIIYNNMRTLSILSFISTVGYVTATHGIPVVIRMIERELMKPKLIISSSKLSYYEWIFGKKVTLHPMIFTPSLQKRLDDFTKVTSMIHKKVKAGKTNVMYRNLMLYGPPGTGKTLFAKELAKRSGLEYACMSGSSFSKFRDGEGIEALDELFAWANKSKGLLIFIDEAETFLSDRNKMDPQSKAYQLLNNFLNYTGERSNKFMLVFATNHQESLDSAMYRRIDDLIEIPLPGKAERICMLDLYKDLILLDEKNNDREFIDSVHSVLTENVIEDVAVRTKGLSGGELEGIVNTIKTDTDILDPAVITLDLVEEAVQNAITKHATFTNGKYLGIVED